MTYIAQALFLGELYAVKEKSAKYWDSCAGYCSLLNENGQNTLQFFESL
jgi:hypothetical protein